MKTLRNDSVLRMTELAILTAIVILLQTLANFVPVTATAGNLSLIPIAIGAMLLGPRGGAWLGFVCGAVIFLLGLFGLETVPFVSLLLQVTPIVTCLLCIVKTTAAGLVAGLVFRLLKERRFLSVVASSALVPIVNTGLFFLGSLTILEPIREAFGLGDANVVAIILTGFIGVNFFIEFATVLVLTPAIERILGAVKRTRS